MPYLSALVTINRLTLLSILVDPDQTYPVPGARLIAEAQRDFPALPIILVSPRIGGFSRSLHSDSNSHAKEVVFSPTLLTARSAKKHYNRMAD